MLVELGLRLFCQSLELEVFYQLYKCDWSKISQHKYWMLYQDGLNNLIKTTKQKHDITLNLFFIHTVIENHSMSLNTSNEVSFMERNYIIQMCLSLSKIQIPGPWLDWNHSNVLNTFQNMPFLSNDTANISLLLEIMKINLARAARVFNITRNIRALPPIYRISPKVH